MCQCIPTSQKAATNTDATPAEGLKECDMQLLCFNLTVLSCKKLVRSFFMGIGRLNLWCIFHMRPECHTVSKAFWTSLDRIAVLNPWAWFCFMHSWIRFVTWVVDFPCLKPYCWGLYRLFSSRNCLSLELIIFSKILPILSRSAIGLQFVGIVASLPSFGISFRMADLGNRLMPRMH